MSLSSIDDFIKREFDRVSLCQPMYGLISTAPGTLLGTTNTQICRTGWTKNTPAVLPAGTTGFIPTRVEGMTDIRQAGSVIVARLINLGSIDISGASGTFTDGDQMPTVTVAGNSLQMACSVIVEVEVVLNATPGSITITYVDQDGNAAETTTAQALTASSPVTSCGMINLNGTDWGVRDITAVTRSVGTTPTGTLRFWGVQPICIIPMCGGSLDGTTSVMSIISSMVNVYSFPVSSKIGAFMFGTNGTYGFIGSIFMVGDT